MGLYYSPLSEGSVQAMGAFIKRYGFSAPPGDYLRLLICRYYEECWRAQGQNPSFFGDTLAWKVIKKEFEDYLHYHPDDLNTRGWYLFFACQGNHVHVAYERFTALGDHWNANFHWSKDNFFKTKARVEKLVQDKR